MGGPWAAGVLRHAEDVDGPALDLDGEQRVELGGPDRVHHEEVDGQYLCRPGAKEASPALTMAMSRLEARSRRQVPSVPARPQRPVRGLAPGLGNPLGSCADIEIVAARSLIKNELVRSALHERQIVTSVPAG